MLQLLVLSVPVNPHLCLLGRIGGGAPSIDRSLLLLLLLLLGRRQSR